jgi:peptide/nickel transport system substrate-binding protein
LNRRIIGALALALAFAACSKVSDTSGAGPSGSEHSWTQPGNLRIAIQGEPVTLNPLLSANTTEGMLNRLSFDVLISVKPDGKTLVPMLAADVPTTENGGISKDGLTITYKLRSGVKWQDGVPFTSKDVKFSWQAVMNPNNNVNSHVGYEEISRVDTPDDTTVVFHLKRKFAPFVDTIFAESDNPICIVPEHILGKYANINQIPFNGTPIGTGPYKVARWIHSDHIELVANPDYFLGAPKLKQITVRIIPDENTEINLLRTHEIDWMFEPSPTLYAVLKTLPDTAINLEDSPQTLNIFINNSRATFKDLRVRQALAYLIDKAALVNKLTGGSATVGGADQPPSSWAYEPNIMKYPPNVAKARALLAQAGYTTGPDGMLQKGGQPFSIQISTNQSNATRRLVEANLQSMLRAGGIDLQIKNYPSSIWFATYGQGGIQSNGKYDLTVTGWIAGLDPDDHSLFRCDQIPPAGTNYMRYCSKAMDAAQDAALASYDQATRKKAYSTVQKLIATDIPEIVIWYTRFPQATNPDFKGFAPNPINEAWNAYQWEI